ncbi:unnamed protein product, partial [Acanthocheilonema viteae]
AASAPCNALDEGEVFEKVNVEISPINVETNKGKKEALSKKDALSRPKGENTLRSTDAFSRPSSSKSSSKTKEFTQSKSTSSKANPINKSEASLSPALPKEKMKSKKSSGTISSQKSKTDKIKSIKSQSKTMKGKVKEGAREEKKQENKGKKKKEEKEKHRGEFKIYQKKMKVSENLKKKEDIKDVKKKKEMEYEITKGEGKKQKDMKVLHANIEQSELALGNEKLIETSGKHELNLETSKLDSDKLLGKAESLPANGSLEGYPQNTSDINLVLKPIEMTKKDPSLFEKMDDEIVLDTNLLQSLATDLVTESDKVNKDVIGEDIAKKLIEIEKKDQSLIEDHIKDEKEVVISEVARRIVEALTSNQVLGKVLTPEEATILRDYFSRKIPLSEKVLATLDTALDKILCRAHEFYDDKKELDAFLKDRDSAKAKILDALIAKKSNYLADLMSDASFYADRISKGLIDVYKLATEGILVARDNLQYMQAAVGQTYHYSKQMAYRGAALTYETAARGKKLAEIGASASAQMTSDAAKMTLDAAIRGKELAERGAAIGTKMTSDAAKMTLDAAIRGKELAERGAAIGTKMTSDAAKMTQDAAFKGLQIAGGTIHVASIGKEMVKDTLTAASSTTVDLSETALESTIQATKLVGKKVQDLTGAMNQAKSQIQKSGEWFLSFFQPATTSEAPSTLKKVKDNDNDDDSSDDESDKNDTSLSSNEKSGVMNE